MPTELSDTKLKAAIDQVDNYEIAGKSGKMTNYLTHLKSLEIDENRTPEIDLEITGDISDRANAEGMEVSWKNLTSYTSATVLFILSMGVVLAWLLWPKVISRSKTKGKDV